MARLAVLAVAVLIPACERESRRFSELAPASAPADAVAVSELQAGAPFAAAPPGHEYEENAWAIGEGKRYFEWFNCHGCHGQGGGGMGPPFMDESWIYGGDPANVYASIVEGRPDGMPAFRGRVPRQQVWQIVAYVRSMSGQVPKDAAPGRGDAMAGTPVEMRMPPQPARTSGRR